MTQGPAASPHNASLVDVEQIAHLVESIRPDPRWPIGLVRQILMSVASQVDCEDLAVAAIRAAGNPNLPTPKAILWRGEHWKGARTMPVEVAPRERCSVCQKPEARCYSERPGPDDHEFAPERR